MSDTDELLQLKIGSSVLAFYGSCVTILFLLGFIIVLNIISIRIKQAESSIRLSKYLFELLAFKNPFKFKQQR